MRTILLAIILTISHPAIAGSEEQFEFKGSFDNVRATESGHCYGTSLSIWGLNNKNIIGLLDVHSGLCGDPPCSLIKGELYGDNILFNTKVPIYKVMYTFEGRITNTELSGLLNESNTVLKVSPYKMPYKNKKEWCSMWSKVSRCKGVKEYCK